MKNLLQERLSPLKPDKVNYNSTITTLSTMQHTIDANTMNETQFIILTNKH
jgi:hypothetical protein